MPQPFLPGGKKKSARRVNEITIIIIALVQNLIFAVKNEILSLTKWSKLFQQFIHTVKNWMIALNHSCNIIVTKCNDFLWQNLITIMVKKVQYFLRVWTKFVFKDYSRLYSPFVIHTSAGRCQTVLDQDSSRIWRYSPVGLVP